MQEDHLYQKDVILMVQILLIQDTYITFICNQIGMSPDRRYRLQDSQYANHGDYHRERLSQQSALGTETRAKLMLTADVIQQHRPRFVMDLGCGEGVLMTELSSRGIPTIGVESSETAINLMPPTIRRNTIKGDMRRLPVSTSVVPAVTMIAVLEHIPTDDISGVLQETHRVLEDNGLFVVRVPSTRQPMRDKHYQHFTPDSLKQTLEKRGFFTVQDMIGNHNASSNWDHLYEIVLDNAQRENVPVIEAQSRVEDFYDREIKLCGLVDAKRLLAICRKN